MNADIEQADTTKPVKHYLIDRYIPVLDEGFIALKDFMGGDADIVEAARTSFGFGTKSVSEDRTLLRFLFRHRHSTPFEMVELKFHVKLPIFVARQLIRHRTASVNEYSLRYSLAPLLFYMPEYEVFKKQSAANRQGRGEAADREVYEKIHVAWSELQKSNEDVYRLAIIEDIARELARIHLPLSLYTEWYWKIDLKNLLHFLSLRSDGHAQWEIQQYSNVKAGIVKLLCPDAFQAWIDYAFSAVTFSRMEMNVLFNMRLGSIVDPARATTPMNSHGLDAITNACNEAGMGKREIGEFLEKLKQPMEPPSFDLDLSQAKTAAYFYERAKAAVPKL